EQPIQLLKETRPIIPAMPTCNSHTGHPERVDYEYERNGTASVFMFVAPFENWRRVAVREHRTKLDWAEEIERLVMHDFADAKKVTIILDNLNTHTKGSFYQRFEPEYCREILRRCEFVFTPVHGSWLNIAECELSVLTKQCLCGRIGSRDEVRKQVAAWMAWRNEHAKGIHWQFTTDDARIKLDSVYPKFHFDNE
ncbi:MAG: transposase, partial [Planctomycetaceae bacterium]|nr:transposase [Planctomycetaceae bacterium]